MTANSSDSFDPYQQWLGLVEEGDRLNHYSLLAVPLFEADITKISEAADIQMKRVRVHQTGPRGNLTQQILNQIAEAKVCLTDPEAKQIYDAKLKGDLSKAKVEKILPPRFESRDSEGKSKVTAPPPVEPSVTATKPAPFSGPSINTQMIHQKRSRIPWEWVLVVLTLVALAAAAVGIVYLINRN